MNNIEQFSKCLEIVDAIIEEGGYNTIRVYLASVMLDKDVYENVLDFRLNHQKVKEVIQEKTNNGDIE